MNLDNIKTKGVVDDDKFDKLSNSIAESIIDMRFVSKENVSALVKAQFKIFYEKQHVSKLGLKIKQLEDNIAFVRLKAKNHNTLMKIGSDFWRDKLKMLVTENELQEYYTELNLLEEKIKKASK